MLSEERKRELEEIDGQSTNEYDPFEGMDLTDEEWTYIEELDKKYVTFLKEVARSIEEADKRRGEK